MVSNSILNIEKFDAQTFELWKLTMEGLLPDKEERVVVDHGTTPTSMMIVD
jgi:hypothetical protein